jgi:hypothetical protein
VQCLLFFLRRTRFYHADIIITLTIMIIAIIVIIDGIIIDGIIMKIDSGGLRGFATEPGCGGGEVDDKCTFEGGQVHDWVFHANIMTIIITTIDGITIIVTIIMIIMTITIDGELNVTTDLIVALITTIAIFIITMITTTTTLQLLRRK